MSGVRSVVDQICRASLPTRFGEFEVYGFENKIDAEQAVVLVKGSPQASDTLLVRIHSQCFTGDTFHSLRCDCGEQMERSLQLIEDAGCGILVYQMQEGRGIGLLNKIRAYGLQDKGVDTVEANVQLGFEADERSYGYCAEILKYFGVKRVKLLSNNPNKIRGLEAEGIEVVERVPLAVESSLLSEKYLKTKKEKLGHLID